VLSRFTKSHRFGMNVTIPAASLNAEPTAPASPVTLHWPTFEAAADEAGISRRYGGIHFRQGDLAGRTMGTSIGRVAFDKARRLWGGVGAGTRRLRAQGQ
jgi:hypothetical protein